MSKHSITLQRSGINGFLSTQTIGTDALNALHTISIINDVQIVRESNDQVELTYSLVGDGNPINIGDILDKFGLARVDTE